MASNNENHGQIELLSEDNYSTWAIQMEALLVKNQLWDYVSGEELLSDMTDDTEKTEWQKNDKEAKCELILCVSPSELKHIRNCETSHEMWNKLKSTHEAKDKAKKKALLKQLVLCHSTNDNDMENYTTEFYNIVGKLDKMNVEIDEELFVIMFLQSLPRSYDSFKYAFEFQNELPTLEVLKIKIMEEIKARSKKSNFESKEPTTNDDFDNL